MDSVLNLSVILSIIGVLVVLTNIIVQVVEKVTWGKLPTNILAVIVLGFMVSYAAMFGYDKLIEAIGKVGKLSKIDQELGQKIKNP